MLHSRSPTILLVAMVLSLPLHLSAKETCAIEKCSGDSEIGCFRGVERVSKEGEALAKREFLTTFMRSNPSGSLECFRQQVIATDRKEIADLSAFSGFIGGDVKPDNVDIVKINGDWHIGLIDLDDGGWGSLLGDVFHTLSYNEVWEPRLTFDEAVAAYRLGLQRTGLKDVPTVLGDSSPPERSCEDLQTKWNKALGKDIKRLEDEEKESRVKERYVADQNTFSKEVQKIGVVRDNGFEMKTASGGSMCMPRFVYLVRDNEQKLCDIVQFKLQRLPAAAVFSGGESDHEKRLASLIEYYRPSGDIGHLVKAGPVRGESNGYYIVRYDRIENFKATSKKRLDREQFAERHAYSKRMLHWLGQVHAQQNPAYAATFEETFETTRDELKKMIDLHIAYLEKRAGELEPYKCGQ